MILNSKPGMQLIFVEEGNKVKVSVIFKGRELAYIEHGENLLNLLSKNWKMLQKLNLILSLREKL